MDGDGNLLARFPDDGAELGWPFAEQPAYRESLSAEHPGTVVGLATAMGARSPTGFSRSQVFPLAVVASVDNAIVLKPWNVQAVHSAVRTSLFCLSVLLLLTLVLRQLRRREQAEASLRVQTALLDELFESAPEAIVMLDLEQRVTRVNREFTRMFGFAVEQALGRPLGRSHRSR